MKAVEHNIHATAISVGGTGLVFVGPSGSGKSALAFDCLAEARFLGLAAGLVGDDRLVISAADGRVVARGPLPIRGMIELRYSGIVSIAHVSEAELKYAVRTVAANESERLPANDEHYTLADGIELPLIRVPPWSRFPLSLILARTGLLDQIGR
ncbi:HPr kinase/phosphorylase [Rhizobium sp. CRIBSB]|nr:HPr kinase/phosphorylase [Rhizobium sp. CRIBSB]